jgi:hypothetical protein
MGFHKSDFTGKTRAEIQQMLDAKFRAGKIDQKQFDKASKILMKLNSGGLLTDKQVKELVGL